MTGRLILDHKAKADVETEQEDEDEEAQRKSPGKASDPTLVLALETALSLPRFALREGSCSRRARSRAINGRMLQVKKDRLNLCPAEP
jgi:hypothetical protein